MSFLDQFKDCFERAQLEELKHYPLKSHEDVKPHLEVLELASKKSQDAFSFVQSQFKKTKVFESFLESAPQVCLQLYIVATSGTLTNSQILTIASSMLSITSTSVSVYLTMPLEDGTIFYDNWKNKVVVYLAMILNSLPRIATIVIAAVLMKYWLFLAVPIILIANGAFHWKIVKEDPDQCFFGLFCSLFSSCLIRSQRGAFLRSTGLITTAMYMMLLVAFCLWVELDPLAASTINIDTFFPLQNATFTPSNKGDA